MEASVTYDHWKSTNPADEFLGPDPDEEDDGREHWRDLILNGVKTKQDEIAPRAFEWVATIGDYDLDDPIGRGATEAEAIQDLLEQLEK
jgi:hypothetical protein